jgi:5-formyltetrahydrofolate cyclo-ligase
MQKSQLRKQALAQRKALSDDEWSLLNKKLLDQFKTLDFSAIKSLHIFLPIVNKKEPDTFLFIDWLQQKHPELEIVVPKVEFESSLMNHFSYQGKEDLIESHYQIPEPQNAKPFVGTPDMVIVPLLAFDQRGYRVGYGKGFYDRFLQGIETEKVGLSLFDAVPEIEDVHLNDIKLDLCVTPYKIVNFNQS